MIKYLNNSQLIGSAIGKEFDEFLKESGLKPKIDLDKLERERIDKMIATSDIVSMHKELEQLQKGIDHNEYMLYLYKRNLEQHSHLANDPISQYNSNEKIKEYAEKIKKLKDYYFRVELAYNRLGGISYYRKVSSAKYNT